MDKPLFLVLSLAFFLGCASEPKQKRAEDWQAKFDQVFTDGQGAINFARTHYIISKTDAFNRVRENKIASFMKKSCKEKQVFIIRKYQSESDFLTLADSYRDNLPVKVFEFTCK